MSNSLSILKEQLSSLWDKTINNPLSRHGRYSVNICQIIKSFQKVASVIKTILSQPCRAKEQGVIALTERTMTSGDRLRFSLGKKNDWKTSDAHLTINASFWPQRHAHMSKHSMSVLLLSTSVQGPLLGNKPQNTNKEKMPWLCYATSCPQLRAWLWTSFFHVSTERCSGSKPSRPSCYFLSSFPIPVWCPFFGFTVEVSQKKHLLWRADQSRSG